MVDHEYTGRWDSSLWVAVLMVVIGMDTFIIQPGFVQGLVDHAAFNDGQAGMVASAEMFGIAAATILMTGLSAAVAWRRLIVVAFVLDALGNGLCIHVSGLVPFAALRFVVGVGSGILISLGYDIVGRTSKPDRNFGLLITCVLIYGALGLLVLPRAFNRLGLSGVVSILALLAILGLFLSNALPREMGSKSAFPHVRAGSSVGMPRLLALGGVFAYFLAQGSLWAYLSLIGIATGASEQEVAGGLMVSQFAGIAGAVTATLLGPRLRHGTSLVGGIVIGTVPMAAFLGSGGALMFSGAVSVFNLSSNFVTPIIMGIVASVDRSGRLVVVAVALQMLGLAFGPAVSAVIIAPGHYAPAVYVSGALFIACLGLMLPAVIMHARRVNGHGLVPPALFGERKH